MQVFGDIDKLKSRVEKRYIDDISSINKDLKKQITEINKTTEQKVTLLKAKLSTATQSEVNKVHSKILSAERLAAKKVFEQKREQMINKVFDAAFKKATTIAHSQQYIDFVKKNLPKDVEYTVVADSKYYQKHFPEVKIKVDKSIVGMRFLSGEVVYDLTLTGAINSKREIIRHKVSQVLF